MPKRDLLSPCCLVAKNDEDDDKEEKEDEEEDVAMGVSRENCFMSAMDLAILDVLAPSLVWNTSRSRMVTLSRWKHLAGMRVILWACVCVEVVAGCCCTAVGLEESKEETSLLRWWWCWWRAASASGITSI
jgi:hypothetical protein